MRLRKCDNPTAANGGNGCVGKNVEIANCPIDGGWGMYGAWSVERGAIVLITHKVDLVCVINHHHNMMVRSVLVMPLAAEKSWIADNLVLIIIVVVVCVAIAAGVSSGDDSNVTGAGELEEAYGGFESYATMGNGGVGPDST